jgi:hypothetical protein
MKKTFLAVLAGVAVVLAFGLPAQAADVGKYLGQADFNFRGQYWMWGSTQENTADYDSGVHDRRTLVYQRFRWYFDTSYEDKYGGTIGFEWNWDWGSDLGDVKRLIPGQVANAPGGGPRGDDLSDITRIKHAYLWFMVPSTPVKVTAGLGVQPSIDPQNIMYGSDDYFGVRLDVPIVRGVVNLTAFWLKDSMGVDPGVAIGFGIPPGTGNPNSMSDDSDYYGLHLRATLAKWLTIGTYHVWEHIQENGASDFEQLNTVRVLGGRAFNGTVPTFYRVTNGDVFWHGLYFLANQIAGTPIFFNGHVNYMYGQQDSPATPANPDMTGAWAFFAQLGVRTGPFMVSARGWWFDGDKTNGDTQYDNWFGPNPYFATLELWASGYKSFATGRTGYEVEPGGNAFLGVEASWQVTNQLTLNLLAGHLWWTTKASKPVLAAMYDDKDLGWEIDLDADYKIYPNLTLTVGFNYLFAGSGLDHQRQVGTLFGAPVMDGARHGADDAIELYWRLMYTF